MKSLPGHPFDVCRYEWIKTDGYGKVCLDAKHYYSTKPELCRQKVLIGIRAHRVDVLSCDGSILVSHRRAYAQNRTDTKDYSTALAVLLRNLGAWQNSGVREFMPEPLRLALDSQPKQELKESLRLLNDLTKDYGFGNAMAAMEETFKRGRFNISDTSILAARMAGYGLTTPPDPGPDLAAYDLAFLQDESGICHDPTQRQRADEAGDPHGLEEALPQQPDGGPLREASHAKAGGVPPQGPHGRSRSTRDNKTQSSGGPCRVPHLQILRRLPLHQREVPARLRPPGTRILLVHRREEEPCPLRTGGDRKDPHGHRGGRYRLPDGLRREVLHRDRACPEAVLRPGGPGRLSA